MSCGVDWRLHVEMNEMYYENVVQIHKSSIWVEKNYFLFKILRFYLLSVLRAIELDRLKLLDWLWLKSFLTVKIT